MERPTESAQERGDCRERGTAPARKEEDWRASAAQGALISCHGKKKHKGALHNAQRMATRPLMLRWRVAIANRRLAKRARRQGR